MNATLTITLAPELFSRVDKFLELLGGDSKIEPWDKEKSNGNGTAKTPAPKTETVGTNGADKVAASTSTAAIPTAERVREAVGEKAKAGKREEVKELLSSFNVKNVTSLPEDQYVSFMEKLKAI